jgi:hypothetical protein
VAGTPVGTSSKAIVLTLRGMAEGADASTEQAELEPGSDAALIAEGWATLTPLTGVREDLSEGGGSALAAALASCAAPAAPVAPA